MIDWSEVADRLDGDGEFRVAARLWTATVRLDVGDESGALRIVDGRVRSFDVTTNSSPCDVFVSAPADVWDRMLQPTPAPFYQHSFAARISGAAFSKVIGLGHFPMSEDPTRFRPYLLPVLTAIKGRGA